MQCFNSKGRDQKLLFGVVKVVAAAFIPRQLIHTQTDEDWVEECLYVGNSYLWKIPQVCGDLHDVGYDPGWVADDEDNDHDYGGPRVAAVPPLHLPLVGHNPPHPPGGRVQPVGGDRRGRVLMIGGARDGGGAGCPVAIGVGRARSARGESKHIS